MVCLFNCTLYAVFARKQFNSPSNIYIYRFTAWPDDALLRVAENFILSMKLDTEPTQQDTVENDSNQDDNNMAAHSQVDDEDDEVEIRVSELEKELIEMVMLFNTSVVDASSR